MDLKSEKWICSQKNGFTARKMDLQPEKWMHSQKNGFDKLLIQYLFYFSYHRSITQLPIILKGILHPGAKVKKPLFFKARSHTRFGSSNFAERYDFNRNSLIFSNRHCWQQRQRVMFSRLNWQNFGHENIFLMTFSELPPIGLYKNNTRMHCSIL